MRRRKAQQITSAPLPLQRYKPAQWDSPAQWQRARNAWYAEHPEAWPHGLAVFAGFANVMARMAGRPSVLPGYDEGGRS